MLYIFGITMNGPKETFIISTIFYEYMVYQLPSVFFFFIKKKKNYQVLLSSGIYNQIGTSEV
jgi:hypothetical protein